MDLQVQEAIKEMFGKACCRQRVGPMRSLSLGFGKKIFHNNPKLENDYYGEWELGNYSGGWRVLDHGKILCASHDPAGSIKELDATLSRIELGHIKSLEILTPLDIRICFDRDIAVDFLGMTSDEDECFHIFCPEHIYVEFSCLRGWTVGKSNKPW